MSVYRRHTVGLLRRYFNMSVELGRLPNILGREFFRSHVKGHAAWFEDGVLFVHDVERCLQQLHPLDQLLIARCILQEYTHEEAARLLRCTRRTILNRLPDALDALTILFLERRLLIIEKPRVNTTARTPEEPPADATPTETPLAAAPTEPPLDGAHAGSQVEEQSAPEPGIIPDLSACGNLFVKPPAEAFCV
jgi:hypothetical protein